MCRRIGVGEGDGVDSAYAGYTLTVVNVTVQLGVSRIRWRWRGWRTHHVADFLDIEVAHSSP